MIRAVQEARKAAGLEISDRITLKLTVPAGDVTKIEQFKDLVAHDTSADSVSVEAAPKAPSWPWKSPRPEPSQGLNWYSVKFVDFHKFS